MNNFFNKDFDSLIIEDIQWLVSQKIVEGQKLEYKRSPYERNDEGTRELLRDVTSIANSAGGYLLIGINEDQDGLPTELLGIEAGEDERDRMLSILLTGVDPRMPGLKAKTLAINNGRDVLVFFIPRSHRAPHLITNKGLNQFWIRHDRQKSKMSVDEIRDMFVKTENLIQGVKDFLSIRRAETIAELKGKPYMAIGALPLFSSAKEIVDVRDGTIRNILIEDPNQRYTGWSFNFEGYGHVHPTLEGLIAYPRNAADWKSLRLYRNGYFETKILIDEHFCREGTEVTLSNGQTGRSLLLYPYALAEFPVSFFRMLKKIKEYLGVEEDHLAFVSLFNIRDYSLKRHRPQAIGYAGSEIAVWDKDHLEIPALQINLARSPDDLAKIFCDRIWQAFSYEDSPMFENGVFRH